MLNDELRAAEQRLWDTWNYSDVHDRTLGTAICDFHKAFKAALAAAKDAETITVEELAERIAHKLTEYYAGSTRREIGRAIAEDTHPLFADGGTK